MSFYFDFFRDKTPAGVRNIKKTLRIVSGGFIGKKGDVVVDNYLKPTQILGIADGSGKFEKKISKRLRKKIQEIQNSFNLDF